MNIGKKGAEKSTWARKGRLNEMGNEAARWNEERKERRSWHSVPERRGRISRYRKTASNQDLLYAPEFRLQSGCSNPWKRNGWRMMSLGKHSDVAIISAHGGWNKRLHAALVNIYLGRYLPSRVWSSSALSCRHMYTGWFLQEDRTFFIMHRTVLEIMTRDVVTLLGGNV